MAFRSSMRRYLPLLGFLFAVPAFHARACTAFTVTRGGHTFIGCNEDAWSINAQVRFEPGRDGGYGAIYFGHFNGSPMREMIDQMGMNEAGLVFDGLSIPHKETSPKAGLKQMYFNALMPLVLRTCATVREAADLLRTYDHSLIPHSMIFLADRQGGWLIVENDTLIEGHDPWHAVGNWRMGSCSDPDSIPIPRLQEGRHLLMSGTGASLEEAQAVLSTMSICRKKLGAGTLFSALFDPIDAHAHLFFYHDFSERVSFDLKAELAKGARTMDMAALFGARPEYDALKSYITPFHQRWLFWAMTGCVALALLTGAVCIIWFVRDAVRRLRHRTHGPLGVPVLIGLVSATVVVLLSVLLLNEAPYYFGLADVHPALAWLPVFILALMAGVLFLSRNGRMRRWSLAFAAVALVPVFVFLAYWHLLLPG